MERLCVSCGFPPDAAIHTDYTVRDCHLYIPGSVEVPGVYGRSPASDAAEPIAVLDAIHGGLRPGIVEAVRYPVDKAKIPEYQSHKIVRALKILAIVFHGDATLIHPENPLFGPFWAAAGYVDKFRPRPGDPTDDFGYFVVYDDGHESWSPSQPFEEGYVLLEESRRANEERSAAIRDVLDLFSIDADGRFAGFMKQPEGHGMELEDNSTRLASLARFL
jgi:hypothetical protein